MKKISVVIPTYNEEDNVMTAYERVKAVFQKDLPQYDYEILFIDNKSTDKTRDILTDLCSKDKKVKCIFHVHNFHVYRSFYHGLTESDGDATFFTTADMQDPPELLPQFVKEWEKGTVAVIGIKHGSREPLFIRFLRKIYYKVICMLSSEKQIANFNGFGLYDRSFIEIMRQIDERDPFMKGLVSTYAASIKEIPYKQEKRTAGKGTTNFFRMYDYAMIGITASSKVLLRICTFVGVILSIISLCLALITVINKLINWNDFQLGMAALTTGVFFLGGVQLFFLGMIGEYILSINTTVARMPVVVEEKRINFETDEATGQARTDRPMGPA